MKNLLLLLGLLSISVVGCEPEKLSVEPNIVHVDHKAGAATIKIESNISWKIDVSETWLTVNPISGSDDESVSLTYTAHNEFASRDAIITIKGGNSLESSVLVTQDAAIGFQISWEQKAEIPTERNFLSPNACNVNNKIYVIGGSSSEGVVLDVVEAYDPASDSWETKAPLNKARWGYISEVVGGKIYVMGGCLTTFGDAITDMEIYDPVADTWTLAGKMPTARLGFGSCVVDDRIYVMGGRVADPGGAFLASMDMYDTSSGEWTSLSPMPSPKAYFSSTAVDHTIYAVSGVNKGGGGATASVFIYDIAADSWSEGPNLNKGRWGIASTRLDTLVVCAGGYTSPTSSPKATVEIIYTNNDLIIETTPLEHGISVSSMCEFNGKIYVFGGAVIPPPAYGASSFVQEGTFILPE